MKKLLALIIALSLSGFPVCVSASVAVVQTASCTSSCSTVSFGSSPTNGDVVVIGYMSLVSSGVYANATDSNGLWVAYGPNVINSVGYCALQSYVVSGSPGATYSFPNKITQLQIVMIELSGVGLTQGFGTTTNSLTSTLTSPNLASLAAGSITVACANFNAAASAGTGITVNGNAMTIVGSTTNGQVGYYANASPFNSAFSVTATAGTAYELDILNVMFFSPTPIPPSICYSGGFVGMNRICPLHKWIGSHIVESAPWL